ncbi:MAG: nicotinamide mononucleotide transporter [Nitrosopumilus sp.]
MSPDFIGWIATAIVIFGTCLLSQKKKSGWLIRVVGNVLWVVVGFMTGLTSIIACEGTFILVDMIGYFKWKKDEDK